MAGALFERKEESVWKIWSGSCNIPSGTGVCANEHRGGLGSNERLEFLGDSVLGFVAAEFLFKRYGSLPEGDLTRMRAALVCEQSLYEVARELELGGYLKLGRGEEAGGGRERQSILADAVEAVFAAVYLDGGMDQARDLINRVLRRRSPEPCPRW